MHGKALPVQPLSRASSGLRIAVVTETFPPEVNGVAMTIGRTVAALRERQHFVQLIRPRQHAAEVPASGKNFEEVLIRGLAIPRYEGLRFGLPAGTMLLRQWSSERPDIVHVVTEGPLGWSALHAARRLGLPLTTGFHTNFHSYSRHYGVGFMRKPIAGYLRRFHNRADANMAPTEELRAALVQDGYENVRVVARGVDTNLFSPVRRSAALRAAWGARDDAPVMLFVGRLAPEKNLVLVVRCARAIEAACPGTKLVWVGDGPERAALQRHQPEHIFAGVRTGEDLATHYASGDLFVFPSTTETFGNVTLEAMASGLAVIAFDYAAAREHIAHGVNGMLARFGAADDFIAQARAAAEPRRLAGLRVAARAAAERIDWSRAFDDFEAVLRDTIRRGGPTMRWESARV
jgi:glycosyltransferase involved in cell wall biosynthesis